MNFLAERRFKTKPIRNPELISVATCYTCPWRVMFADRDHYTKAQAEVHRQENKGHKVFIRYKGDRPVRTESENSES